MQHAEQPLVQIREWVMKRLKHLLGFDEVDGLVDNLMKLQSAEEIEKYIKDILGTERKAVQKFTEDLIQKRKDASPLFRTVPIRKLSTAGPSGQGPSEPNVKVYRKKDEVDPYMVKKKKKPVNKPKDQGASPPTPNAGQAQTGGGKKKGGKQQAGDSLQLPGRAWCGCMAARHPLLGNCLYCGKIVCAQEGVGPCLFCGNAVGEAPGAGSISLSKQEADAEYDASLARALEHKDKLLEYERTSARRTVIYDDQQDYFQTDGSQWMTPEQRKQMKKLEEERRKQREDAKNKVSISFDFAGRRVMVDQGAAMDDAYFFEKADDISRGVLQNPTLRRPAPVFTAVDERPAAKGGSSKATGKATADHAANKEKDEDEYNRKLQQRASKRVQHDYYAIDSEWTPEEAPTTSSSSSSSSSSAASSAAPTASQRSFKFRGLCERAFDYAPLYPSAAFHRWSADDRRTVISTLRQTSGLTTYLYVVDATAASGGDGDAELARVGQLADVCAREGVELVYGLSFPAAFFTGAALEKDKVREQVDKLRVVERMTALSSTGAGAVTRFAFFFDDAPAPHLPSTTSPTMLGSAGGKTSLLSSLHAYVANHLLDETRKRAKQAASALKFFLLPLFYGKDVKENRSGGAGGNGPKQTPSFGTQQHKKEQEAEMDRDVVQYWKEMDRNTRPDFTFLFSGFTSIEPRAPRGSSAAPSAAAATIAALDGISLGRLRQLVQQHKVVLLDTYPSLVPTFKSTTVLAKATTTATTTASASLVRSFPAITHLQGYEASAHAAAAEWADGLAVQVASALVPPHAGLVPLLTAFDFMLAPHTHDPTIALKSALLRLLQGEERLADELLGLIDATPSASSSLAIRRFKIKKLATPTFFHETADRMSYVRKSLSSTSSSAPAATAAGSGGVALERLGEELRPFFVLLDTFLDMNAINFELEAFFEKQKQTKHAGAGGGQKWDEFTELKKRLTEVERKLDVLLAPAYPLSTLKHNQRDLNTAYLEG